MKIGILYIATGKYDVFWKNFYKKMNKYFLPEFEKTYFVFTDSKKIKKSKNVVIVHQNNLGWPNNTLLRFEIFLKIKKTLIDYDYLYFLNANMVPLSYIGQEIFPSKKEKYMVTLHPGFYKTEINKYTYDRNKKSLAYIPYNKGKYYFMGGFNGGIAKDYLIMCEELNKNTYLDLKNNVVALWHDESHLNKYMLNKAPLILDPSYGYPEGTPFNKKNLKDLINVKILIQDKKYWGGAQYLRGESKFKNHPFINKIKNKLKSFINICNIH